MRGIRRKGRPMGKEKKNPYKTILLVVGIVAVLGVSGWLLFTYLPQAPFFQTPTEDKSTITLISYDIYSEDVSDFVEVNVYVPKSTSIFEENEDIYTLSKYELEETSKDADDISLDFTQWDYIWIEIDPDNDTLFMNTFHLVYGGVNFDYSFYVYDLSTDINFNLLNRDTLAVISLPDYATNGNYTLLFDVPHHTTTADQLHVGSDWNMDDDEFDDLTASEKIEYYDEKNWAVQTAKYDPSVDTDKDFDDDLEKLTEAFCFRFEFNTTISTANGNTAQINCTLADAKLPIEIVISGTYIYHVFYETIDFRDGDYSYIFGMEFGTHIELDDIDSGRVVIAGDDDTVSTFSKLSDIGA